MSEPVTDPEPPSASKPVAIISGVDADAARLETLLVALGRRAERYETARDFDVAGSDADALLLCHRAARAEAPVPRMPTRLRGVRVIVLSDRDDEPHLVELFAAGAHHVFDLDESARVQMARIHAGLRRHGDERAGALAIAPFRFDLARHRALLGDTPLALTPREFEFAYYMFAHRGRLVSNAELLTSVWSLPQDMDTRRIDTAACRVRKKMHLDDRTGWVLRRFRREGYGLYGDTRSEERQG